MSEFYWTAYNNSTFLNGHRKAKSLLAAVKAARRYLRFELHGEGKIMYFDGDGDVIRTDEFNIFTKWKWVIAKEKH